MKLPGSKDAQKTLVVVVLLGVLLLWLYLAFVVKPLWVSIARTGTQIRDSRRELQFLEQAIAQEPQLRQEETQLRGKLEHIQTALPPESAMPSVMEFLSDLASQTDLKIRTIFPQRTLESVGLTASGVPAAANKPPELYKEVPIQIDAIAGYHQLGAFLSRVESRAQPMELKSLRISGDPKEFRRHNMKVVISAYFSAAGQAGSSVATRPGG